MACSAAQSIALQYTEGLVREVNSESASCATSEHWPFVDVTCADSLIIKSEVGAPLRWQKLCSISRVISFCDPRTATIAESLSTELCRKAAKVYVGVEVASAARDPAG